MIPDRTPGLGASEAEARGPVRLLVVEDDRLFRETLEMILDMTEGFQASYTDSAADALRILREARDGGSPIEAVLSDLGLTDSPRGGFEIADAVRTEGLAAHFTLFTGQAGDITPEIIGEYGINLLLDKEDSGLREIKGALEQARQAVINPASQSPQEAS